MKKVILIFAVLLAACSSDEDQFSLGEERVVKKVTLNTEVIMASEANPIMQRRSSCSFPALYEHAIPSTFNVYFIPTDGSEMVTYANVGTGRTVFELLDIEYKVVVTNSTATNRWELPQSSDVLLLFGENTVDFATTENVDVTVTNDYASIMVVKNKAISTAPVFGQTPLHDFGTYYNLYYRTGDGTALVTGDLGINNWVHTAPVSVKLNEVTRFMICAEDGLNIILDGNILTGTTDTTIDRNNVIYK